jgi:hypothetical protein
MTFFMYYGLDSSCCNDCDYHDASIVDTVHIYFAADIPEVPYLKKTKGATQFHIAMLLIWVIYWYLTWGVGSRSYNTYCM